MDAHPLFDFQERQLPGLPGLPGLSNIIPPIPTPTIIRGRPGPIASSTSSVSSSSISSASSASASSSSAISSSASASSTSQIVLPTPSTPSSPVVLTTLPASTHTVTALQSSTHTPSATASATAGAAHSNSFLQNKVLSGVVFAVVGVVGLILLVIALTFVLRRKRNRRLVEDAVSFDPVKMGAGEFRDTSSLEAGNGLGYGRPAPGQGQGQQYARSSSSTGRASNGPEIRMTPPFADYAPPPVSSSQQGYQYQNQYQSQYQSPSANMSAYTANASYPQQTQGYQGYDYDYDYGNNTSRSGGQQQAYNNSNGNTWSSKPATLAIPPTQTGAFSPVSPSELGDPYGGIAMTPPAPILDDVDRSRRRSKSSSTEIKFASPTFQSNSRPNEMR